MRHCWRWLFVALITLVCVPHPRAQTGAVDYSIVYVQCPRVAGHTLPDVFHPFDFEPHCTLQLLRPNGTEETLVDPGPKGAVFDPFVTHDGRAVLYAMVPDVTVRDPYDFRRTPAVGSDIYRIDLATKAITQLTHGEYEPNAARASTTRQHPVFHSGPAPLSGGRIVFTSNRWGLEPPKGETPVTTQLFTMRTDGTDVEAIAPMSLSAALHPFQLTDGRIAFSTHEPQGARSGRLWGYWAIWPDGTTWKPLLSAFAAITEFHFASQLSDGQIVATAYYLNNNQGFGWMLKWPARSPIAPIGFASPLRAEAPGGLTQTGQDGRKFDLKFPFQPIGATAVTPFTHSGDVNSPKDAAGKYVGKVSMPSGAPRNDLLLAYTPTAANCNAAGGGVCDFDSGIYLAHNGLATTPADLVKLKNDPAFNELQPVAVVPYKTIYGVDAPAILPTNKNDGTKDAALRAGSPFGIVGTASVFQRESFPGQLSPYYNYDGLEPYNVSSDQGGDYNGNWTVQGSDAGLYTNADIASVRLLLMEGRTALVPQKWAVPLANERLRVLGEVRIQADGSFAAKIPADTPFTFQLLDHGGHVLTMAQTWHQVRPGEKRIDCGGCHSHSKAPLDFATSLAAARPPADLTLQPAHDVTFEKDIRPILRAKCASCHNQAGPAPRFDATDLVPGVAPDDTMPLPRDYAALARNRGGTDCAGRPCFGSNVSRWVRVGQSRRSLLMWTLDGKRGDGWPNARWPDDVDVQADHSALVTDAERRLFATWIDLFAPIDLGGGFFVDETRPTLALTNVNGHLLVGVADAYSGVKSNSLRVTVNGQARALTAIDVNRFDAGVVAAGAKVAASAEDTQGNRTTRSLTMGAAATFPVPPVDDSVWQSTWNATVQRTLAAATAKFTGKTANNGDMPTETIWFWRWSRLGGGLSAKDLATRP